MKKIAFTLSMLIAASVATGAQAMISNKVDTSQHSSSQLQQMIKERGSLIFQTGPGLFDRYVSNRGQCGGHDNTRAAYVPTAASTNAFVGYRCVIGSDDGYN